MRLLTISPRMVLVAAVTTMTLTACAGTGGTLGGPPATPVAAGTEDSTEQESLVDTPAGQNEDDLEARLGQDEEVDATTGTVGDPDQLAKLQLELRPIEDAVPLGGLIGVQAVLTNPTDGVVNVAPLLDPVFLAATYTVEGPGRESLPFSPPRIDEGIAVPQPLEPGGSVAYVVPLYDEGGTAAFTEPGRFSVTASFATVPPATVELTIEQPPDDDGLELLTSTDGLAFAYDGGGEHLPEVRGRLAELSDSGSALAPYATYSLIRYWSQPARDFTQGEVRQADVDLAFDLVERGRDQRLAEPWIAHALLTGLHVARAQGDQDLAAALEGRLAGEFADVPAAATALARYDD